jgi:hypothetical protein
LEEAKSHPDCVHWKQAVQQEMDLQQKNNTWSLVKLPEGAKVNDCKWLFQFKKNETANVSGYKARLVARGFMQEKNVNYSETYAPVAKLTLFRLFQLLETTLD